MTEKDENRVHHLLDCCDVNGHIDINAEDMVLILKHQRELGKEDVLKHLADHDKAVGDKTIEAMAQIITKLDYDMGCVSECKHVDDGVSCTQCVLGRAIVQMKEGENE